MKEEEDDTMSFLMLEQEVNKVVNKVEDELMRHWDLKHDSIEAKFDMLSKVNEALYENKTFCVQNIDRLLNSIYEALNLKLGRPSAEEDSHITE